MNAASQKKYTNNVRQFPSNGTSALKDNEIITDKTSNQVLIDIPEGHKATIVIENNSYNGDCNKNSHETKKIFMNRTIENEEIWNNYNSEIINNLYMKKIEEEAMKREILTKIHVKQIKFLLISFSLIVFSLIGIISYNIYDFIILHPALYIMSGIMGLGWGATVIATLFENRG